MVIENPDRGVPHGPMRSIRLFVALVVGLAAVVVATSIVSSPSASAAEPPGMRFVPVTPCRLLDTRQQGARPAAGATIPIVVSGRCGVPAGGGAVSLTITATDASTGGYLTVKAAGTPLPDTSNVNFRPGAAAANSAIVAISPTGAVDVFASSAAHVIVDVSGVFVPVTAPVAAGRFVPITPSRLLDTRLTGDRRSGDLTVPLPAGVPSDATALAVSVTLTDTAQPVYATVYPSGSPRPDTSVVNSEPLDRARSATVLAAVGPAGLSVFRSGDSNVIVDIIGWFTGPSAPASTDGLFVAATPRRVWDSRSTFDPLHPGGVAERQLVDGAVGATVVNVTVADATAPGYVSAYPAGLARPNVSMMNVTWRAPLAAMTVVSESERGTAFYASTGVQMIVDVAGWFRGQPVATTGGADASNVPASFGGSVLFISDSSLAGIRWNNALGWLQGANFVAKLESCRRLIGASCRGREGYAPQNAVDAVLTSAGTFDTLVVDVGYNDYASSFAGGFDAVVRAARARGIARVVWLDYRDDVGYVAPAQAANASVFGANNATLRAMVGSGAYPDVTIASWDGYSSPRPDWFTADGVHVTGAGPRAAAEYISRTLAALDRRVCPPGIGGATTQGGWCALPDATGPPAS